MAALLKNIVEEKLGKTILNMETFVLFNFFILMFFSFSGTGLPFRERHAEALEAETTNFANQLIYGYLIISSIIVIIRNPRDTFSFIQKEKYLTAFVFLCVLSAIWSNYSFLSIKRSSQLVGSYFTIINVLLFAKYESVLNVLKVVSLLYLIVTYISGLTIQEAIDPAFGTWKGIELQKNGLGQAGNLIFNLSLFYYKEGANLNERLINFSISILAAGAVILSGSSTNAIALLLVLMILMVFYLGKTFKPVGLGRTMSFVVIIFFSVIVALTYLLADQLIAFIPAMFGKDMSLTGRDDIWSFLILDIQRKLLFGYGYDTYWMLGTGLIERFMENVGWRVNTAHNGYIDLVLQLGLVGITLFFVLIIVFLKRILKVDHKPALITLIGILVINFSETLIFQPRGPTTAVFMFAYSVVSYSYFYTKLRSSSIL